MARGKQAFPLASGCIAFGKLETHWKTWWSLLSDIHDLCKGIRHCWTHWAGREHVPYPLSEKEMLKWCLTFPVFYFYFSFSISFFSFFLSFFLPLLLYFLSSVVVFSVIVLFCLYVWNYWGNLPPSHLICTSYSAWLSRRKYRVRCLLAFSILYTRSQDVYPFSFLSTRCIKRGT